MKGHKGNRDANEQQIIDELAQAKITAIRMPEGVGFDLLIPFRGVKHTIEIKNPEYVPKHGNRGKMLTEGEWNMKLMFQENGCTYPICVNTDEVLRAIGAM